MRTISLLMGGLLLLAACGAPEVRIVIDTPTTEEVSLPYGVGVIEGRLENARALRLDLRRGDETLSFDALPGWSVAVRKVASNATAPVAGSIGEAVVSFRKRLEAEGIDASVEGGVDASGFVVCLQDDADLPRVIGVIGTGVEVRLAIEVRPREAYRPWEDGRGRLEAPRLAENAPWAGSAETFHQWKANEVQRWWQAKAAGMSYGSSRDDMQLVRRDGTPGAQARDFAVVLNGNEDTLVLDPTVVQDPAVGGGPAGGPVVLCSIRPEAQDRLEAMTRRNLGLPMAILVDGVYLSAPVLQAPLRDAVQITLGHGSYHDQKAEAEALVGGLRGTLIDTRLQAAVHRGPEGGFQVFVPPTEEGAVVRLFVIGPKGGATEAASGARSFLLRPGAALAPEAAATAVGAALRLHQISPREAAARLKPYRGAVAGFLRAQVEAANAHERARLADVVGRIWNDPLATRPVSPEDFRAWLPVLRILENDADAGVRLAAVRAIRGGPQTREVLQETTSVEVVTQVAERVWGRGEKAADVWPDLVRAAARFDRRTHRAMSPHPSRSEDFLPSLRAVLHSLAEGGDASVRATALAFLWDDSHPTTRRLFARALRDPAGEVRLAVIAFLASDQYFRQGAEKQLEPEILDAVAGALRDEREDVRDAASRLLWLGGPEGHDRIAKAYVPDLARADAAVRARALDHLRGWIRYGFLPDALGPGLGKRNPDLIAAVRALIEDEDGKVRRRALALFWRIDPQASDVLIERLSAEPMASDLALDARLETGFWSLQDDRLDPLIERMDASDDPTLQAVGAHVLWRRAGKLESMRARLVAMEQSDRWQVRYLAATGMHLAGREDAIPRLQRLVGDVHGQVRRAAARGLYNLGADDDASRAVLEEPVPR